MNQRLLLCVAVSILAAGCSGGTSRDGLVREYLSARGEVVSALDQITDQASAEKAIAVVDEQTKRIEDLSRQLGALGKPTEADKAKQARYSQQMEESSQAYMKAWKKPEEQKAKGVPADTVTQLGVALNKNSEASRNFGKVLTFGP